MSSPFSRGLHIYRMRRTSYTMDGFCLLYLLLILLMRSGDVETNPGPNTAESTVSKTEFLKLAQHINPSYYQAVGISLGFSSAQLQANLDENLKNYTNALLDVFMKWNVVQQPPHSNKRQLLADRLREIDSGSLSDRLLTEPLFPASTGGPSRLSESQTKPPSAESRTKPFSPELVKQGAKFFKPINSTVSEMEFLKLAQAIPSSYYETVGISLGIPLAQLQAILSEKLQNYTNAFLHLLMISMGTRDEQLEKILSEKRHYTEALFDVFMKWNIKQQSPHSNKRQLLADKLREIDSGSLSDRLLYQSLFPIGTGGPFRLLESQTKPPSAESQTKPLSPELVERCANDFKFKYRSTLCKIRADPLNPASIVPFDYMYTNLVLQEENGTDKQLLDYNEILDLKVNGEFPKRIMIQGEAGAGKTTFCAKIAWDWIARRYFSHFVWVLIVPLREFKQHTIGEIAKSYLDKSNPTTVSQITNYIRSNPDKVFIAFDGLDEVSGKIIKTKSCKSQPTDQLQLQSSQPSIIASEARGSSSESGDIGLVDILCSEQLASCPVLVTTRPWRAVEIRSDGDLMKLYTFIHVEGFNRENLSVYIHKYFSKNEDKANQLIQFTSENDVISQNMAHYPIYVAMLCLMWKELDEPKQKETKSLNSFSQIFKEMIAFLKEHYAQKMVKKVGSPALLSYLRKIDELLGPIAKQALNGLLENTLVFGEDDFQICPESKDTACRVGILSQEDRIIISMHTHDRNSHVQLPVFFPHKLFQEYMAGVHLASLYESDRNEFNRLIEQVVLPRKEEFRYLLYFTVSQNKSVATYVMQSMLQGLNMNIATYASQEQLDFIVDVAFESRDPDVAALVKDRVSSEEIVLNISEYMTAHTVAGYAYIKPYVVKLCVERDCGPTVSLDVAEMICSMPSLKEASLQSTLHHCFFETLARKGKESKVQSLKLVDVRCPTPASSHHLAEALCSMPNLTDLTLEMDLNEEFYSALKAKASSIEGCFPQIRKGNFRFNGVFQDDLHSFLHTFSCLQSDVHYPRTFPSSDHPQQQPMGDVHYPRRTLLPSDHPQQQPMGDVHYPRRTLLPSDHPQQQPMGDVHYPRRTLLPSDHPQQQPMGDVHFLRRALPPSDYPQQQPMDDVHYLRRTLLPSDHPQQQPMGDVHYPRRTLPPSDHPQQQPMGDVHYLRMALPPSDHPQQQPMDDFNFPRRALPLSDQPQQQPMDDFHFPRRTLPPSDHPQQQPMGDVHYLRMTLPSSDHPQQQPMDDFHFPRRALPPSDRPQQQPMGDVHYLRMTLPPSDHPQQQPMGDVHYLRMTLPSSNHPQQQPMGNVHYPRRAFQLTNHPQRQLMGNVHYPRRALQPSDYPQRQPMGDVHYPRRTLPTSDHPQQQPMGNVHYPRRALQPSDHPQQQPKGDVHYPRRALQPSDHPQQQPMGNVHYPRRALQPSDRPQQQQPMGDVHYPRRALQPSDHPQQQPMGNVHYPRRALPPSDHPQQQPMGDLHYPRRTLPSSDHPQQQPIGDVHYPRRTFPPSDHPQQQPIGDVHYPRRTLPSSDHSQQHVGNTSDTVFQFSQTHREGSSSLSRPFKRQATCTQSRVPQDDPEIPEKQSKYEV